MSSEELESTFTLEYFNDSKFTGVDFINQSIGSNQTSLLKFIRVCREFYSAQDLYVKALQKVNNNMSHLLKDKSDGLHSIFDVFSTTICLFTNIQQEFTKSIFHVIRNLNEFNEQNLSNLNKTFSQKDMVAIDDFKAAVSGMDKCKMKYYAMVSIGENKKQIEKAKCNYEDSVKKYNSLRTSLMTTLTEGFGNVQAVQLTYLDNMRRCIKVFGNSFAKFVFDMKESVDSLKHFYRHNSKEDIYKNWVKENKTVSKTLKPLMEAYCEIDVNLVLADSSNYGSKNDDLLVDLSPSNVNNSENSAPKGLLRKLQNRKLSQQIQSTSQSPTPSSGDNGKTDLPLKSSDSVTNNDSQQRSDLKNTVNRTSVGGVSGLKSSSRHKWSNPFTSMKRFKSASDLSIVNENNRDIQEVTWQSKSNLHEKVIVDDEGFIVRDETDLPKNASSSQHSNSSFDSSNDSNSSNKRFKNIKVQIRPAGSTLKHKSKSNKSELIQAAGLLPPPGRFSITPSTPKYDITPPSISKRTSNLQRSSRPVSYESRENYRRSMSVTELKTCETINGSISDESKSFEPNSKEEFNMINTAASKPIPLALAFTEVLSGEDIKQSVDIDGQLIVALPSSLKSQLTDYFIQQSIPDIEFELIDNFGQMLNCHVTQSANAFAKLDKLTDAKYQLVLSKEQLTKYLSSLDSSGGAGGGGSTSNTAANKPNRISIPLIEYDSCVSSETMSNLLYCGTDWKYRNKPDSLVDFQFDLMGQIIQKSLPIKMTINLISHGSIEDVVSDNSDKTTVKIQQINQLSWTIQLANYEPMKKTQKFNVSIKNIDNTTTKRVCIRVDYEFNIDNCGIVGPTISLVPDSHSDMYEYRFDTILIHRRTLVTDRKLLSEYFDYKINSS